MDRRKRIRATANGKFTRLKGSLQKLIDENKPMLTIKNRYIDLKAAWSELQDKHEEYVMSLADDDEVNTAEHWMEEVNEEFDRIEVYTDQYMDEVETAERMKANLRIVEEATAARLEEDNRKINTTVAKRSIEEMKFKMSCDTVGKIISKPSTESLENELKIAMIKLANAVENMQQIHQDLMILSKDEEQLDTKWLSDIIEIQDDLISKAELFRSHYSHKHKVETSNERKEFGIKLCKLKFDSFDGDIRKYPLFKQEFIKFIRPQYKPNEEAFVLKTYLEPSVRETVNSLGDDAESIWNRLDAKYGDEGKLIDSIMTDIKSLKPCKIDDPENTLKMIERIERAEFDLRCLGMEREINNSTIVSMIEERLPLDISDKWLDIVTGPERASITRNKFPALLKLLKHFKERIEYSSSSMRNQEVETVSSNYARQKGNYKYQNSRNLDSNKHQCWLHVDSTDHPIWACRTFQNKSAKEKIELVRKNNACFACLAQGHQTSNCNRGFKCPETNCGLIHHKLLHEAYSQGISFHGKGVHHKTNGDTILQIQLIKAIKNVQARERLYLNCLWDGGSTLSFITFKKANELNLKGYPIQLQITKIGGTIETVNSKRYTLELEDKNNHKVNINVLGLDKISTEIEGIKYEDVNSVFFHLQGKENGEEILKQLQMNRPVGNIDCLFGFEYAGFHPTKKHAVNHLLILENCFGYVLGGRHPKVNESTKQLIEHATICLADVKFQDFYNLEQLGIRSVPLCGACKCGKCHPGGKDMSLREEREWNLIKDNLSYDVKSRKWTAAYPWIKDPKHLPNNRDMVLRTLKTTEKRLKNNTQLAETYNNQIEDMKIRNVCRKITNNELMNYKGPVYYLTHHEVLKPGSKSTPCRIVFNTSANYRGHVLNDYYAKGPDMLNNILGILFRFREGRYALIGDIAKMYHSINITLKDQMTHLFLWRNLELHRPPTTYVILAIDLQQQSHL